MEKELDSIGYLVYTTIMRNKNPKHWQNQKYLYYDVT